MSQFAFVKISSVYVSFGFLCSFLWSSTQNNAWVGRKKRFSSIEHADRLQSRKKKNFGLFFFLVTWWQCINDSLCRILIVRDQCVEILGRSQLKLRLVGVRTLLGLHFTNFDPYTTTTNKSIIKIDTMGTPNNRGDCCASWRDGEKDRTRENASLRAAVDVMVKKLQRQLTFSVRSLCNVNEILDLKDLLALQKTALPIFGVHEIFVVWWNQSKPN